MGSHSLLASSNSKDLNSLDNSNWGVFSHQYIMTEEFLIRLKIRPLIQCQKFCKVYFRHLISILSYNHNGEKKLAENVNMLLNESKALANCFNDSFSSNMT